MMKRHEAYWLLNELRSSCTKTEQEAIDIALNDIEFVDLMGDKLRTARHGRWEDNGIPESVLSKCSECGIEYGSSSFNYCPNCGEKMEKEEK